MTADTLATIMFVVSLIALPFALAACGDAKGADDRSDQLLDLIDGDIRPADLLRSVRNADALISSHETGRSA